MGLRGRDGESGVGRSVGAEARDPLPGCAWSRPLSGALAARLLDVAVELRGGGLLMCSPMLPRERWGAPTSSDLLGCD